MKDSAATVADAFGQSIDETEANAKLIAAAPELLEACKRLIADSEYMRDEYSDMNDAVDQARAAIARATKATP